MPLSLAVANPSAAAATLRVSSANKAGRTTVERGGVVRCAAASGHGAAKHEVRGRPYRAEDASGLSRRALGAAVLASSLAITAPEPAAAVMGMTAGRLPGLAPMDADGKRRYTRPEGKSGGHGVGWSEITQYTFNVYEGWEEVPVSIADPAGSEIDCKFENVEEGDVKIILAPILRFADVPEGAKPTIEDLIPINKFVFGFGPELTGQPVQEEDIIDQFQDMRKGLTYYNYELANHNLITATVHNKRVYIISLHAGARQWRKCAQKLRDTRDSFEVLV